MYNYNKAQQSKNRVHISWDILYIYIEKSIFKAMYRGRDGSLDNFSITFNNRNIMDDVNCEKFKIHIFNLITW